jgi:hypothetical protein
MPTEDIESAAAAARRRIEDAVTWALAQPPVTADEAMEEE